MSDSLAERLAERLDIQPEQTDRLLRTLAQLIQTQASRDGQVRVPGLGRFKQEAEALTFEPDLHFAEAVNPHYAHLPTVSLATLATPPIAVPLHDEPKTVPDSDELEAYGDTAPAVEADEVNRTVHSPSLPVEPEDVMEEEQEQPASFHDEDAFETKDTETSAFEAVPPPLPDAFLKQDLGATDEDDETAEDELPGVEESVVEEESVWMDESIADEDAGQDDDDFIASLLADEPEDADDDITDDDEDVVEDPDLSESEAYTALQQESASFDEDTFLEESEPSAWAPPGTRWTGENQDQLVPIEDNEDMLEPVNPSPAVVSESNQDSPNFAPPALQAVQKSSPKEVEPPKPIDLPPRAPARIRHYQDDGQSPQRSVWPWLLAALLFVVIAGGAYYYFNLREQPIAVNELPPTTQSSNIAGRDSTETATTGDMATVTGDSTAVTDTTNAVTEDRTQETVEPPAEPTSAIDRVKGGYTLVVGSRGSREAAEADAERVRQALNDDSIPVDVLQGTANGTTRFRIGVGQVETTDAAVTLKQRLGNRITADAWVTRILPDS